MTSSIKIYAAADIHGDPGRIKRARARIEELEPDLVIMAGDIGSHISKDSYGWLEDLDLPVLAVRGNSDHARRNVQLAKMKNVRFLECEGLKYKTHHIFGISGTIPLPFASLITWREAKLLGRCKGLIDRRTLLVAHPPPRGAGDRVMKKFCAGSFGLARLVLEKSPLALICGHIHEDFGTHRLGKTEVINVSMTKGCDGALLKLNSGALMEVTMLTCKKPAP